MLFSFTSPLFIISLYNFYLPIQLARSHSLILVFANSLIIPIFAKNS
ncbi:hypothetical protein HMPREF9078_02209 [Capnocytophaga sp. oral taxon 380 str. F0488]|nr:hypothetical protein HMPREF9078_02209 [Capnocytophaga sp. oral taxon 380 str. F0488]